MKEFYGDQTRWFIGDVLSIADPLELGRCQVRINGIHGLEIADSDVPYAQTVVPVTEGGTNGLGNNLGIQPNARVFGIFLDGQNSQSPLVLGSMPKIESENERSTSKLARGTNTLTKTVDVTGAPEDPYAAVYPNNAVHATKSGHVIEIDDTPNGERIHIHHKSGSFIEFHPDGTLVIKSSDTYIDAGANANISASDANIKISGSIDMTASSGDIVVDGISLVNHTHRDNPGLAGAITTPPLK